MFYFLLSFLVFQIACEDSTPSESPPVQAAATEVPPAQKPATNSRFDPLQGKSLPEVCSADGLLLIKWPYTKIQNEFRALCCSEGGLSADADQCEMDWPFSDVPKCDAYDALRNEIFARYGRAFQSKKWQTWFGSTDWRPDLATAASTLK